MNKFLIVAFTCGMFFEGALISLMQDLHGKEKYIEMIQNHWISGRITVPLALIIIIAALNILYDINKQVSETCRCVDEELNHLRNNQKDKK